MRYDDYKRIYEIRQLLEALYTELENDKKNWDKSARVKAKIDNLLKQKHLIEFKAKLNDAMKKENTNVKGL